jgi:hypothetical protein
MIRLIALITGCAVLSAGSASAQVTNFILRGVAGDGLLSGNQVPAVSGGSGGLRIGGITFDGTTHVLTIDVGWGSGNGFTDLTGNAIAGHLHGPTASVAPASFTENAGVQYPLDPLAGWNPSATNGGFNGSLTINAADVTPLLNGQFYMNVHTTANGGGEIRGNLVAVSPLPEPGLMIGASALGLAAIRSVRRRFKSST